MNLARERVVQELDGGTAPDVYPDRGTALDAGDGREFLRPAARMRNS